MKPKYVAAFLLIGAFLLLSACALAPAGNASSESPTASPSGEPLAKPVVQLATAQHDQQTQQKQPKQKQQQGTTQEFTSVEAPSETGGILLGAPEATSIVIKALADSDRAAYVEYGTSQNALTQKTASVQSAKGEVTEFKLSGLQPDTQYVYRLLARSLQSGSYTEAAAGTFHTQRKAGKSFVFAVQADPHRDENSDLALYRKSLQNVLAAQPDFLIDLGDTFMGEKLGRTEAGMLQRYLDDRAYFSTIGSSVPLFLVNGNHEGENGWSLSKDEAIRKWAVSNRLKYFVNPTPDGFYTGSKAGSGNYYAFTWGDALFVTLDPFWFSASKAKTDTDGWSYTLGRTQYDWLKTTLANSSAKYKFVFIHNLVGGYGKDARGGAEAAKFFEWGGTDSAGAYTFDSKRPGWGLPIHKLLVQYNVSAVFHGHDHFYAHQQLDGVVYQLVPQPSHPGSDVRNAEKYSYVNGKFLPPAGYLRVGVTSEKATVDYISALDGTVKYSYSLD